MPKKSDIETEELSQDTSQLSQELDQQTEIMKELTEYRMRELITSPALMNQFLVRELTEQRETLKKLKQGINQLGEWLSGSLSKEKPESKSQEEDIPKKKYSYTPVKKKQAEEDFVEDEDEDE